VSSAQYGAPVDADERLRAPAQAATEPVHLIAAIEG
jgi:hypothetical protein